ncbi:hypothetical protein ACFLWM_01880 [Chloroflexota bacterium]
MSKLVKMITMALVFAVILTLGISSAAFASNPDNHGIGPAPSAGDGESEGPEWDLDGITIPYGPNGEVGSGSEPTGPAGNCNRDGSCQL